MSDEAKVVFGGAEREVKPFTLGELRKVLPAFNQFFDAMAEKDQDRALEAAEKIIPPALGLSDEEFSNIGTDFLEIWLVVEAAAKSTGMKKLGEHMKATTAPLSTGTT